VHTTFSTVAREVLKSERLMAIDHWDPFRDAVSLRDAMNALFQDSFVRPGSGPSQANYAALPLDVCETEQEFVIKAALPGVNSDDV
jgi:HSP20 family protein